MEHIQWSHPFRVTLCQIVVHCNHVNTITGKCVQEHRQCCNKGFTFTGCHFGNFTLTIFTITIVVKNYTTYKLYIIVYHAPSNFITTGYPMILIISLITLNRYEIFSFGSQVPIKLSSCYFYCFIFFETTCSVFNNSKHQWKNFL